MIELQASQAGLNSRLQEDPCGVMYRLAARAPGEQILLKFQRETILICQDVASAHQILRHNWENYQKNFGLFTYIFGESRLTSDGERWRALQKLSQPLFNRLDDFELAEASRRLYGRSADALAAAARADALVTIDPHFDRAAALVFVGLLFGVEAAHLPEDFFQALRTVLKYCGKMSFGIDLQDVLSSTERKELESGLNACRTHVTAMIAAARGRAGSNDAELTAFFAAFPTDQSLFGEFCTLLFAGFDTSASSLCWCLMLLASLPERQAELREELSAWNIHEPSAAGKFSPPRSVVAFINEAMRLFPVVPFLSRISMGPDDLNGTRIEARQKVLVSIIGLHHNSAIWREPAKFEAARFAELSPSEATKKGFLPFSIGPRACAGSRIAMVELTVALKALLERFQFGNIDNAPVAFAWGVSMRRRHGVRLMVSEMRS